MARIAVTVVAVAVVATLAVGAQLAVPVAPDMDSLVWLAGCWQLEKDGVRIDEQWMAPAGGLMLGIVRTVRNGAVVAHEHLLLRAEDGGIVLTASPFGQATTSFRLVAQAPGEVAFANPAHDFPQRISYRKTADGKLVARVEGLVDGKLEGLDFPYRPVPCGPVTATGR